MTATAGFDVSPRRQPAGQIPRPEVVVRLHPEAALRSRPPLGAARPGPAYPSAADLDQLSRAVHALVDALAPGVLAEVIIRDPEPEPGAAGSHRPDLIGDAHIQLDRRGRTLLVDGQNVPLTRREFELLAHLAAHRGVALSRRELMTAVWHERYLPGDRTVDVHVRRLRVKLGRYDHRVKTLRGFGYRFD